MVATPKYVLHPGSHCDICGQRFVQGDKALMVVKVPSMEHETICLEDYTVIIASASAWLKQRGTDAPEVLMGLIREARDIVERELDRLDHEAPAD